MKKLAGKISTVKRRGMCRFGKPFPPTPTRRTGGSGSQQTRCWSMRFSPSASSEAAQCAVRSDLTQSIRQGVKVEGRGGPLLEQKPSNRGRRRIPKRNKTGPAGHQRSELCQPERDAGPRHRKIPRQPRRAPAQAKHRAMSECE